MPNNFPIKGDDVVWKREVDKEFERLEAIISSLVIQVAYLKGRVK